MTLKEKFKEILTAFWISNWEDESIKLTDEFAIGFAYWCEWRNDRAFKTYEELLEIYKKQKI